MRRQGKQLVGKADYLPVGRLGERRRQPGFTITLGRVQLGLDEKESGGEVGASQIGISKVSSEKVGAVQIGAGKVGRDETRTSHIGPSEVGSAQMSLSKVSTLEIFLPAPDSSPRQFACLLQQSIDVSLVSRQIQLEQSVWALLTETIGLLQGKAELALERVGRRQRHRFGEIPQQLMQALHNPEDVEHLLRFPRVASAPVVSAERHLGDLLTGTETVVYGAASKPPPSQMGMYTTAEARAQ